MAEISRRGFTYQITSAVFKLYTSSRAEAGEKEKMIHFDDNVVL